MDKIKMHSVNKVDENMAKIGALHPKCLGEFYYLGWRITIQQRNTRDGQIAADQKSAKLEKEIARLEKLARAEKQPKKKLGLVQQINKLKESITYENEFL